MNVNGRKQEWSGTLNLLPFGGMWPSTCSCVPSSGKWVALIWKNIWNDVKASLWPMCCSLDRDVLGELGEQDDWKKHKLPGARWEQPYQLRSSFASTADPIPAASLYLPVLICQPFSVHFRRWQLTSTLGLTALSHSWAWQLFIVMFPGLVIYIRKLFSFDQSPQTCRWHHPYGRSEEELNSVLMKVKEDSEKLGLKLNIQKTKIVASSPITSWEIDGETVETVSDFIFGGLQNHCG